MSNRDYYVTSPNRRRADKLRTLQRKHQRAEKYIAQGRV